MATRFALAAIFLCAAPVSAQDSAAQSEPTVAQAFAQTANASCLQLENGNASVGETVDQDMSVVQSFGLSYGIVPDVFDRYGSSAEGILNSAIMGHRTVGDDAIVLAIGGQLPGCKLMLLSAQENDPSDEIASALSASETRWRELPFQQSRASSRVTKRSFIHRDESGQAYLMNLIKPPIPNSDLRLLATIARVPDHVNIPEGY